MGRFASHRRMAGRHAVALAVMLATAGGLSLPLGVVAAGPSGPGTLLSPSVVRPADGVAANITWNGAPVTQAGSAASAFVIGPGQTAEVGFTYAELNGTPLVTNATLDLLFLGITLSTESIRTVNVGFVGSAEMNWTFGTLLYLTEGVYEVDAKLLDANGSVLLLQPFYVDARAPYLIGSTILCMVIVLGIVEALWIRSVIRYKRGRKGRYRFH